MPRSVFDHNEVYRRQLAQFPEFQHALWRPYEDTSGEEEIAVGDVGYFLEGEFIRLFKTYLHRPSATWPRLPEYKLREYCLLTDHRPLKTATMRDVVGNFEAGAG